MKRKPGTGDSSGPHTSGGPSPSQVAKRRSVNREGDGGKRPPRILNWLQSEGSKQGGASSESELAEAEVQGKVEQYMKMVTSVWKDDEGRAEALRRLLQRDILSGRVWQGLCNAAHSTQRSSSCSEEELHVRMRLQEAGSPVPQAVQSSSISDGEVAQEARSVGTAGSASTGDRRVELCSKSTSGISQVFDGSVEGGSVSPTMYASQLAHLKQAMIGDSSAEEPVQQLLEDIIAAKWKELRGGLLDVAGASGNAMDGLVALAETVREAQLEGGRCEQRQRPPCGDHSGELLERIVAEVRKVVLGVAPLKGSILEQVAEAAYSNKAVVVSPCETCGAPASADMAQILSVSLGHTEEASKLRIGHAAVALLNARANDCQGVSFPNLAWGGPPPPPPPLAPKLDVPSPDTLSGGGVKTPQQTAPQQDQRLTPSHEEGGAARPFLTPPAPKFQGSLDRVRLLPPLPSFNGSIAAPPMIPQQKLPPSGAVDAVCSPGLGDTWQRQFPGSYPETLLSLPASIAGMTAYPMVHGGMSVLLTSKACRGEAALAEGRGLVSEGSPKEAAKRAPDVLEDVFVPDGLIMERQLSADELALQSYLEEEQEDLCPTDADAFRRVQLSPDVQLSADDELDLEDPMGGSHDWEGFLKGDLPRSPSPSPQDWLLPGTASCLEDCQLLRTLPAVPETASCLTELERQRDPSAPVVSPKRENLPWVLPPTTPEDNRGPEQCSPGVNGQTESTVCSGLTTERGLTSGPGLTNESGARVKRVTRRLGVLSGVAQQNQKMRSLAELYEGGLEAEAAES